MITLYESIIKNFTLKPKACVFTVLSLFLPRETLQLFVQRPFLSREITKFQRIFSKDGKKIFLLRFDLPWSWIGLKSFWNLCCTIFSPHHFIKFWTLGCWYFLNICSLQILIQRLIKCWKKENLKLQILQSPKSLRI